MKDVSSECPILKLSFWQSSSCQDFNLVNFCLDQETWSLISSGTSVEPSARRRRSSSWTSSPAASKKLEMTVLQSLLRRQSWWHSGWVIAFVATDPGSIPCKRLFIRKFTIRSVSLSTIVSFQVGLFSFFFSKTGEPNFVYSLLTFLVAFCQSLKLRFGSRYRPLTSHFHRRLIHAPAFTQFQLVLSFRDAFIEA